VGEGGEVSSLAAVRIRMIRRPIDLLLLGRPVIVTFCRTS
jgi:hypothetical protein